MSLTLYNNSVVGRIMDFPVSNEACACDRSSSVMSEYTSLYFVCILCVCCVLCTACVCVYVCVASSSGSPIFSAGERGREEEKERGGGRERERERKRERGEGENMCPLIIGNLVTHSPQSPLPLTSIFLTCPRLPLVRPSLLPL